MGTGGRAGSCPGLLPEDLQASSPALALALALAQPSGQVSPAWPSACDLLGLSFPLLVIQPSRVPGPVHSLGSLAPGRDRPRGKATSSRESLGAPRAPAWGSG